MDRKENIDTVDTATQPPFRLGDWLVQPALNRISNGGPAIQVEPRIMGVLVCLAAEPGEVIPRRTLLNKVWADTIVCEEALTRSISRLRSVLRDDPANPLYIETIRKGGYRLVAPVEEVSLASRTPTTAQVPTSPDQSVPAVSPEQRQLSGRDFWTLGGLLVVIFWLLWWQPFTSNDTTQRPEVLQGTPLTSFPGREIDPAFSPDGDLVAFTWDGEGSQFDLYIKQLVSNAMLRLTTTTADESQPTWSPDGTTIAFVRQEEPGYGIHTVPAFGGISRRLIRVPEAVRGLDWSPDGEHLVYATTNPPDVRCRLFLLTVISAEVQSLTEPQTTYESDQIPAFAPDGLSVAFTRTDPAGTQDLYLLDMDDLGIRRLTHAQVDVTGLDWSADSRSLVYSASALGKDSLWRVTVATGTQSRLLTEGRHVMHPSLPTEGSGLIFEEVAFEYDIWQVQLDVMAEDGAVSKPLVTSTRRDHSARFSPGGDQIVFLSERSGFTEVWICAGDGGQPRQISNFAGARVSNPRWSPDENNVACSAIVDGHYAIIMLDPGGGVPRRIHTAQHNERFSSWSRDGRWLYYNSDQNETWQIWKMHPDGTGATPVTNGGGMWGMETADGRQLYYARPGVPGLWARPVTGGEGHCVLDGKIMADWLSMAVAAEGVYFILGSPQAAQLCYHDFNSGMTRSLAPVSGHIGYHLAVSPDESTFLFDRSERLECDLIMVSDFQ